MLEQEIRTLIENSIAEFTGATKYRSPLVAFVAAGNPGFVRLQTEVDPAHLLPEDILADAQSVISFFLPFAKSIVAANARSDYTAREWAVAYVETNQLIAGICAALSALLAQQGYQSGWELPTHNFDPLRLISRWSHKSVGVIAGLGSFGLHQMVITAQGCAGRFGSLVTTACLTPTVVPATKTERCRYYADGSCRVCVQRCPVGALREEGFDRALCYERCLEVDRYFSDLGLTDVCGKCATGPCALQSAVR